MRGNYTSQNSLEREISASSVCWMHIKCMVSSRLTIPSPCGHYIRKHYIRFLDYSFHHSWPIVQDGRGWWELESKNVSAPEALERLSQRCKSSCAAPSTAACIKPLLSPFYQICQGNHFMSFCSDQHAFVPLSTAKYSAAVTKPARNWSQTLRKDFALWLLRQDCVF